MTGERLAWFRVASHLGIPVEELAERITHREFLNWLDFLEWDLYHHTKEDYYLAQIAAMVIKVAAKDSKTIKTSDYLLKFESQEAASGKEKAAKSKSAWMSWFGFFQKKGVPKPRQKPKG